MEEYVISNYKEVSITSIVDLKIGDLIYHKKSKKLDHVIVSLTNQFLLENETNACIFNFGCVVLRENS
jgi:hypothetical protein